MKQFKNKASKYGFYFGKFCSMFGVFISWLSIAVLVAESNKFQWWAIITLILGAMISYWGFYRSYD